ncbi:hypothetical protein Tco_0608070 [Tanacetum coccineum]
MTCPRPTDTYAVQAPSRGVTDCSTNAITSDSSDESVGNAPPLRLFFFVDIPTVIPSTYVVALETYTIAPVISSAAPVMSSPEHISPLPAILPFLCIDSSEASDSSDGPPSHDPYVATVARWRSRVTSRPSSSFEFPIALVTASPRIRRRKRVRPLPSRRLASRHASPCSSDHQSSSSSSSLDSSPVHSLGLDVSDQAYFRPSNRDVSPRLCYPPRRAPRRSEAFCRWCAAPLYTLYPPTTSESSSGDSSERPMYLSSHSARPSRKRCRSLVDSVPSSTPVMGSLAPTRADLLPPRKRFRDSYSSEASIEEDAEVSPIQTGVDMELEEYEADASAGDTVKVGIDPMSAPIVEEETVEPAGEDSSDLSSTRDGIVKSFEDMPIDLGDAVRDFYHHMSEVRIDRIVRIKTAQSRLEADQLIASKDRARMAERIYSLRLENLKEEFRQIRRDRDDARGRLRRTMTITRSGMTPEAIEELEKPTDGDNGNGGNGNGGNRNGRNENPDENGRGLIRWFEKIETVFHISNCPEKSQVKYATCTMLDGALTWWNSHKRTIGTEAAFAMSWKELMKLMIEVYCLRNEIQKMETEL